LDVKKANFTSHTALVEALEGQDALICTLNDEAAPVQVQLIGAAAEAGVKRFIPSKFAGNEMEAAVPEMEYALAGKKAIIELLKAKAAENGIFFDWCEVFSVP
jgi:uncharacterized protein YbjT (DUF2867 family)